MAKPPVFKVGDRVQHKETGQLGTIVRGPKTARGKNFTVEFAGGFATHGVRLGLVNMRLEFLESANESPATATSK
jgi:hypothetical protein